MSEIRNAIKKEHRDIFLQNDLNKKYTEKVIKSKKDYSRKEKHKKFDFNQN